MFSLYGISGNCQDIQAEKIYLLFKNNDGNLPYYRNIKFINEKGLNFNLKKEAFIHKNYQSRDTLRMEMLNKIVVTEEDKLQEKEKEWRKENLPKLKEKYKDVGIIPPFDKNGIFDPFIIEIISCDKIVIYQVDFRNEGVVD